MLECTRRGVFAIGDVRTGSTKRVAAAVGDGALVVRSPYYKNPLSRSIESASDITISSSPPAEMPAEFEPATCVGG